MTVAGKIAIITGSGAGIGRATAVGFAREGSTVVVADFDPEAGNETVDLISREGGEATFAGTDVSKSSDVQNMVKTTLDAYGRIDILVNNAGVFRPGNIVDTPEADWHRIIDVNLLGVFLCMKYTIPEMIRAGGGVIVNVGSEAGLVGVNDMAVYTASKAGVVVLTKSTALDFVDDNIRINCVCPGRTATEMVEKHIAGSEDPVAMRRILSEDRPLKRMARPEEIVAAILFLASDESSFAIGTALSVDGGYTAR